LFINSGLPVISLDKKDVGIKTWEFKLYPSRTNFASVMAGIARMGS